MTTEVEAAPVAASSASAVPSNVAPPAPSLGAQAMEAHAAQQAAKPAPNGKVYADWSDLIDKSVRTTDYKLMLRQPDGTESERWIKLEALAGPEYEKLIDKHKPTTAQREKGEIYNPDTFMSALIAACAVKPQLDVDQLGELRQKWSPGEFGGMFLACQRICNATPDVSFTGTG